MPYDEHGADRWREEDALDSELLKALEDAQEEEDQEEQEESAAKRQRAGRDVASSSGRQTHRLAAAPSRGVFSRLSEDLALQILACTSAADLTAVSQTSKFFQHVAADNELWRVLFLARWGDRMEENTKLQDSSCWKEKYMERDAQDVAGVRDRVPGPMQDLYLQMLAAKRMATVRHNRGSMPRSDVLLRGRISRWRGVRGLLDCPCPELGCKHQGCARRGPYVNLGGGLFMCESCGWAHQCGDNCPERLIDEPSQLLVCPISGQCFERMLADWEEEGKEGQEGEGVNDFSAAGHWGRAYADGYNCASEEELRFRCGVPL